MTDEVLVEEVMRLRRQMDAVQLALAGVTGMLTALLDGPTWQTPPDVLDRLDAVRTRTATSGCATSAATATTVVSGAPRPTENPTNTGKDSPLDTMQC